MRDWIARHRRWIVITALVAGMFFLIGFIRRYHVPKIKQFILVKLEEMSRSHSPVRVWPERLELNVIPLGVSFYGVRVMPQGQLASKLQSMTVDEVQLDLNIWALIRGQMRLSRVAVRGGSLVYFDSGPGNEKFEFDFSILKSLPVDTVEIDGMGVLAKLNKGSLAVRIGSFNVEVENQIQALQVTTAARELQIKKTGTGPVFDANVAAEFLFDREGLYVTQAQIEREKSYLIGTGAVTGNVLANELKSVKAKLKTRIDLKETRELMAEFFPEKPIPDARGDIEIETDFTHEKDRPLNAAFTVEGHRLSVDGFQIGALRGSGGVKSDSAVLGPTVIDHPSGRINLTSGAWNVADGQFSVNVKPESVKLNRLLDGLKVKNVPVFISLSGELNCSGRLKSPWHVECGGGLNAPELQVTSNMTKQTEIIRTKAIAARGKTRVDAKAVSYEAAIKLGERSEGHSSGLISYAEGFKINYRADKLRFADIVNLSSLQPSGETKLQGETWGDSSAAKIRLTAAAPSFGLYGFPMGRADFRMDYSNGVLAFRGVEGHLNQSRYSGAVTVNLTKGSLAVDAKVPFIDATDLEPILQRLGFVIPVSGTGSAVIKYASPLSRETIDLDVNAALYRGTLFDETYDQITINAHTVKGVLETRDVSLRKGRSQIRVDGKANPKGNLNLNVSGRNFRLEQSENLSRLKLNVAGQLDVDAAITGTMARPLFSLKGQLTKMSVGDELAKSSEFTLKLDAEQWKATGRMIGDAVSATAEWPRENRGRLHASLRANQWNFAQAFSIFSAGLRQEYYRASLTGRIDITAPVEDLTKARIDARIEDALIETARSRLRSKGPMQFSVDEGRVTAQAVRFEGDNTFVRLTAGAASPYHLNLNLEGRLDVSLLKILTPFLEELRGQLNFSVQAKGPFRKPQFLGSASLRESLVKLRAFPHAFEQLNGDAVFDQNKVIINSVRGRLAGGAMSASGQIRVMNLTDVPVDIHGQFSDVKLSVPEGFTTKGSGLFAVRGSWFPYQLDVDYDIESGSIERKNAPAGKETPEVKPSAYLPKFLTTRRFSPIDLNLNLKMRRELGVRWQVARADIRAGVTGNLRVQGPPENPRLTGRIVVTRGGTVEFNNNVFEVTNGIVEYRNSPPSEPILDVSADARVIARIRTSDDRGYEEREYEVSLRVQGTPSDPRVTLASQPQLPETELISLLTLGFVNEAQTTDTETNDRLGELQNQSYRIGSALLYEQLGLGREIERRFGIEVGVDSSYDPVDKVSVPVISLKKQWSPKFGTSASRTLGKKTVSNFRAEYKLNRNLSVIGEWEGQEATGAETDPTSTTEQNLFGVDIEYRVEFK